MKRTIPKVSYINGNKVDIVSVSLFITLDIEMLFNFVGRYCKIVVQIVHKYTVVYLEFMS
jgi:hypothetical protein